MEVRKFHSLASENHSQDSHQHPDNLAPELDIIDILVFFISNAKQLIGFTLGFALFGLIVGLAWPQKHVFRTIIEVGQIASTTDKNRAGFTPVAKQADLLATINSAIIPNIFDQAAAGKNRASLPAISAKSNKGGSIITLESTGAFNASQEIIELQSQVAASILQHHQAYFDAAAFLENAIQPLSSSSYPQPNAAPESNTTSTSTKNAPYIPTRILRQPSITEKSSSPPLMVYPILSALIGLICTICYLLLSAGFSAARTRIISKT